ncbi:MAG: hypothetical protein JXQ75_23680 [Phycisphaerae bacterium]|nr:hypothetical protein [Phycisphaerae bacterium]
MGGVAWVSGAASGGGAYPWASIPACWAENPFSARWVELWERIPTGSGCEKGFSHQRQRERILAPAVLAPADINTGIAVEYVDGPARIKDLRAHAIAPIVHAVKVTTAYLDLFGTRYPVRAILGNAARMPLGVEDGFDGRAEPPPPERRPHPARTRLRVLSRLSRSAGLTVTKWLDSSAAASSCRRAHG